MHLIILVFIFVLVSIIMITFEFISQYIVWIGALTLVFLIWFFISSIKRKKEIEVLEEYSTLYNKMNESIKSHGGRNNQVFEKYKGQKTDYYLNSKARYDNAYMLDFLDRYILDNKDLVKRMCTEIEEENRIQLSLEEDLYEILQKTDKINLDYVRLSDKKIEYFKELEIKEIRKEIEKITTNEDNKSLLTIVLHYRTPQGRNHYRKEQSFSQNDLITRFDSFKHSEAINPHLINIKKERSLMSDHLRFQILKRDEYQCQICGSTPHDGVKLHVDHIYPVSKGGRTIESNLQVLCDRCNLGKGAQLQDDRHKNPVNPNAFIHTHNFKSCLDEVQSLDDIRKKHQIFNSAIDRVGYK